MHWIVRCRRSRDAAAAPVAWPNRPENWKPSAAELFELCAHLAQIERSGCAIEHLAQGYSLALDLTVDLGDERSLVEQPSAQLPRGRCEERASHRDRQLLPGYRHTV